MEKEVNKALDDQDNQEKIDFTNASKHLIICSNGSDLKASRAVEQ